MPVDCTNLDMNEALLRECVKTAEVQWEHFISKNIVDRILK